MWLCDQHNRVNKKLSKPIFPCSVSALDLRWRQGRSDCWTDGTAIFAGEEEALAAPAVAAQPAE